MKKRFIAGMLASALLLQIFATPVMAIEEIIEDNKENEQQEIVQPEIGQQNNGVVSNLGNPGDPGDVIPDYNLRDGVLTQLISNGTITADERDNHIITQADMQTLEQLDAYYVDDFTGLEYATNLTVLSVHGNQANIFDFNIVRNMSKLDNLTVEDIEGIENTEVINTLTTLKQLDIEFLNESWIEDYMIELQKIDRTDLVFILEQSYVNNIDNVYSLLPTLNNLKVKNIFYSRMMESINLQQFIPVGQSVTIDFEDIHPIFKNYILNSESVFYRKTFNLSSSSYYVSVDPEHDQITIDATDCDNGYYTGYFELTYNIDEEEETEGYIGISIYYQVVNEGDTIDDAPIPEGAFKAFLLENFDLDNDNRITQFDLNNIEYLDVIDIYDLTGLDRFYNLRQLTIRTYEDPIDFDFSLVSTLNQLNSITIENAGALLNVESLNPLIASGSLTCLDITFRTIDSVAELNNLQDNNFTLYVRLSDNIKDDEDSIITVATSLENCPIDNLRFIGLIPDGDIGPIIVGSDPIVIQFSDHPIFAQFILNPESRFYVYGFEGETYSDFVTINNEAKTITIYAPVDAATGTEYAYISTTDNKYDFTLRIHVVPAGDYDTVLDIPDGDFRGYLFENNYDIDGNGEFSPAEMAAIHTLDLRNVRDYQGLQYATNLMSLEISSNNGDNVDFDFSYLQDMADLRHLSISNISKVSNCDAINDKLAMNYMYLGFVNINAVNNSIAELQKINRPSDFIIIIDIYSDPDDRSLDLTSEQLEDVNVQGIYMDAQYRQKYIEDKIRIGTSKEFTFDEINPFLNKYILNPQSVFYNSNPDFAPSRADRLSMDLVNKKITINAVNETEPGNAYEWFNYQYNTEYYLRYTDTMSISYSISVDGDHDTEINIPDQELKRYLKDFYDADGNKKITEYDMINIDNINVSNVADLEGLQYATNLRWITVNTRDGALANIDKLNGLNKLERVNLFKLYNVDFADFAGMTTLEHLTISEIESLSNPSSINSMTNLKCLDLSFRDYGEVQKLSAVDYKPEFGMVISLEPEQWGELVSAEDVENVLLDIETFNVHPVAFETMFQDVFVGNLEAGTTNEFYFYDVNKWINHTMFHDGSNTYIQNFHMYKPAYEDAEQLVIDHENQKFIITTGPEDVGEYQARVNLDCRINSNTTYTLSFNLKYKVVAQGRTDYEVTVNDPNLRALLQTEYDFDGNPEFISEYDMFNIDDLEIDDEIYDLTGLDFAKNLKSLRIYEGYISDFSPLRGLTRLTNLSITNSYDGNVDFQFLEDCSDLRSLFVSTNGSFDCTPLNGREYLNSVVIYANRIFNAPILNNLEDSLSTVELKAEGLNSIEGFYDLSLNRNNCSVNIKITNEENTMYTNEQYQNFLASAQNIQAPSVKIFIDKAMVDLGDIEVGENPIEINFTDISEIVAQVVNNTPFHDDNPNMGTSYRYYPNNNEDVTIDINNKKITLEPDGAGERKVYLQIGDDWGYYDGMSLGAIIELRYNAIFGGSTERMIENLDENLARTIEQNYNADGQPGVSEYDMQNLTSMYLYSRVNHLNGIEEAINLKQLSIAVYSGLDLTPLQNLNKLEQLEIDIEDPDVDLTPIKSIPNLRVLNINCYRDFDLDVTNLLKQMPNLQTVRVDFTQDSVDFVNSMPNLERVSVNMPKDKDITPLLEHPSLFDISIFGIDTPLDYNDFNDMDNLSNLTLEFLNVPSLQGVNGGLDVLDYMSYSSNIQLRVEEALSDEDVQNYLNELNKTKGKYNIYNNFNITIDLGTMTTGQVVNYATYNEFSKILGATQDQNSKLYGSSIDVTSWSEEHLQIDTENKTVKVMAGDELGTYSPQLQISGPSTFGNIYVQFNVITEEGNPNTIYQVADPNLQRILEENYDVDGVPGFSERDLLNLSYLDIHEADIADLTGLENAVNLREIQANGNKITSIAPIVNLENLYYAEFSDNLITDVTCLQNRTAEGKPMIWVDANFIDLTDGSASLRALEEKTAITNLGYVVATQKLGRPEDFDNEVVFGDSRIKAKLIEAGAKTNAQGKITRRTLWESTFDDDMNQPSLKRLNLDNMNITNLSGFEYLAQIQELILSNNQISDITPLKYLANLKDLDLSHNNISDLSALSSYIGSSSMGDRTLNYRFAFNNISSLQPLNNWKILTRTNASEYGMMDNYRCVSIDLAENSISSVAGVEKWKNLEWLDLASNNISSISNLENYNFEVWPEAINFDEVMIEQLDRFRGIQLINNNIDLDDQGTKDAKIAFDNKKEGLLILEEGDNPPLPQFMLGDVDNNGVVNSTDVTLILRYLKGYEQLNDVQLLAADVDKNEVVNSTDATKILRFLKGYETLE